MKTLILVAMAALAISSELRAQEHTLNRESLSLTIYNSDLGVVKDVRSLDLPKGTSQIELTDVSASIDPTTVKITAVKHPEAIRLLEQNYEYDLINQEALLQKYIDKKISFIDDKRNSTEGILLASDRGKLTLQTDKGLIMTQLGDGQIMVPTLPQGLITKPTLLWQLNSKSALQQEPIEVLYQTSGITWHAEYIATLGVGDTTLDLSGWISIENKSGASYPQAHIKVVAGGVHSVAKRKKRSTGFASFDDSSVEERGLFDYHLYDLANPTTINDNEIKQLSLLTASSVKVEKIYTYSGPQIWVAVKFKNEKQNNMGMPLPEGIMRVMKRDKDGAMEFIGEDRINHTPRDEEVTLNLGTSFDLIGDQEMLEDKTIGKNTTKQTIRFKLRNHKDEDVVIDVPEYIDGNWSIPSSTMKYEKKDANTIIFHVPVKAQSEVSVTYTAIFSR